MLSLCTLITACGGMPAYTAPANPPLKHLPALPLLPLFPRVEEAGASLHVVSPGDVFGAFLGESERRLREAFAAAAEEAAQGRTVVVFLDEVGRDGGEEGRGGEGGVGCTAMGGGLCVGRGWG